MNFYSIAGIIIASLLININCFWLPTEIPVRKLIKRNVIVTNDLLSNVTKNVSRYNNDDYDRRLFDTTTETVLKITPGNNLLIGQCSARDQRVYTDDTIVENSGPSSLSGTLEIYIDAPIKITCIRIEDQKTDGSGAIPSYKEGGIGYNWVHIDVRAKYGKGFHFKIHIFGVPDILALQKIDQNLISSS